MRILTLNETGLVAGGMQMTHAETIGASAGHGAPTANMIAAGGYGGGYGGYGGYDGGGEYGGMWGVQVATSSSSSGNGSYEGVNGLTQSGAGKLCGVITSVGGLADPATLDAAATCLEGVNAVTNGYSILQKQDYCYGNGYGWTPGKSGTNGLCVITQ